MKQVYCLFLTLFLSAVCMAGNWGIDYDPIAYWTFDSANGYGPLDVTGNGNDGKWKGYRASPYISGVIGNAIYTGSTAGQEYVSVTNTGNLNNLSDFSIIAWVKPTKHKNANTIIAKSKPTRDFVVQLTNSGAVEVYHISDTNFYVSCRTEEALPLNKWSHIAIVRKTGRTQNYWYIYINGLPTTVNLNACYYPPSEDIPWSANEITIGNLYAGAAHTFKGRLDDIRIYDQRVNAEDIFFDYYMSKP